MFAPIAGGVVRLLDELQTETESLHAEADEEAIQLLGPVAVADYWRFLIRTYGYVAPVERSILAAPGVANVLDVRRFHKNQLLQQDLLEFGMRAEEIDGLPQCTVPVFDSAAEALGWAYVVERSTLGHTNLFRHLALVIPGEVAFTSTYLKCYFGSVGEMWRAFGNALDRFSEPIESRRVIDAAKTAFRTLRTWRHHQEDFEREPPSEPGLKSA